MPILTLAEAKAQLNITGTADDAELQTYLDAVEAVVDQICGPVINRTVTETVRGWESVALSSPPVVALTSLVSIYTSGPSFDVAGLHVDGPSGIVRRKDLGLFYGGPFTAVYTAGRGATAPPNINLAARIIVQHLWRTQRGGMAPSVLGDDGTSQLAGVGFAVPNRALELLRPYRSSVVAA